MRDLNLPRYSHITIAVSQWRRAARGSFHVTADLSALCRPPRCTTKLDNLRFSTKTNYIHSVAGILIWILRVTLVLISFSRPQTVLLAQSLKSLIVLFPFFLSVVMIFCLTFNMNIRINVYLPKYYRNKTIPWKKSFNQFVLWNIFLSIKTRCTESSVLAWTGTT